MCIYIYIYDGKASTVSTVLYLSCFFLLTLVNHYSWSLKDSGQIRLEMWFRSSEGKVFFMNTQNNIKCKKTNPLLLQAEMVNGVEIDDISTVINRLFCIFIVGLIAWNSNSRFQINPFQTNQSLTS